MPSTFVEHSPRLKKKSYLYFYYIIYMNDLHSLFNTRNTCHRVQVFIKAIEPCAMLGVASSYAISPPTETNKNS